MRCSRRQLFVIQQSSLCVSVTYMFCESYLLLFVKLHKHLKAPAYQSRSRYRLCPNVSPVSTRRCLRALDMWGKPWFLSQGPVLGAPCRRVTIATDASLTGWGAVMISHPARGLWSARHLTWHINSLEMLAMF